MIMTTMGFWNLTALAIDFWIVSAIWSLGITMVFMLLGGIGSMFK